MSGKRRRALLAKELATVNTIEFMRSPKVLDEIYHLTDLDFKSRSMETCTNRGDLVNLFNLAPDAIDQFLLPLGVTEQFIWTRTPGRIRLYEVLRRSFF